MFRGALLRLGGSGGRAGGAWRGAARRAGGRRAPGGGGGEGAARGGGRGVAARRGGSPPSRGLAAAGAGAAGAGAAKAAGSAAGGGFPLKDAVTCGLLSLLGDAIAQAFEAKRDGGRALLTHLDAAAHDMIRALRMASYGFLLYGPGQKVWYAFLDRTFSAPGWGSFGAKVALNQLVLGPCVLTAVFTWNLGWQGRWDELPGKFNRDAIETLMTGWKFWVPASMVNFSMVPLQYRVAYMSTCAIFWNFYLSLASNK